MARPTLIPLRIVAAHETPIESASARANVSIYRPFFAAGILSVLTAGCLLGAIALFGISKAQSYVASAWTPHVLAHANSQLFGWVGFFVMGFALQHHPPTVEKAQLFHRLAWLTLIAMALGIALRFVAEPLTTVPETHSLGMATGLLACGLQIVAVTGFFANTSITRHRTGERLTWPTLFVFASLFWLSLAVLAEPLAFIGSHDPDKLRSVQFVAEWFVPLREAQFLGFVAMMVFGVSLTKFSTCFEFQPADKTYGILGFVLWTVGLILRIAGWVWAFRHGMQGTSQTVYFAGGICLALGALYVVMSNRVLLPAVRSLRAHKFVRAAYGWLTVAGVLFVIEPIVLQNLGQPFSHAYTGAIRHAVTVGFISQMIVGVGTHVVARMKDAPDSALPSLWPTFWFLNIGNSLRVVCEIGTDYSPGFFPLMGVTGFVELLGIAIWGASTFRVMFVPYRRQTSAG